MAFPRFLVAGIVNTALTYLLYLAMLTVLPYAWAYSLTWLAGVALGYWLNARWVFRTKASVRSALAYPLAYLANYLVGMGLLWLLVEKLGASAVIAPLVVVAITTPVQYVLTRTVFKPRQQ